MKNIFSKAFRRPCSLMMALLLAMVSTVAGAQSLLRVSDDSYKRGLDRFKKGDLTGAIEEFDHALDAYLSNRAAYGAGITPVARTKTSRASPWITATGRSRSTRSRHLPEPRPGAAPARRD